MKPKKLEIPMNITITSVVPHSLRLEFESVGVFCLLEVILLRVNKGIKST